MTPDEAILRKSLVASGLSADEWAALSAGIRDRAFFSSRVESVRFLDTCRTRIAELLANAPAGPAASPDGRTAFDRPITSRARVVSDIMRAARECGISTGTGRLSDPGSEARANVIIDTNAGLAAGRVRAEIANTYGARLAFPAQELVRIEEREKPRDWRRRWTAAGGRLYAGRMVALKGAPVWVAISRFGVPYPPFDFNSGMGVENVSYDEAVALGVIDDDYKPPEKSPLKEFNEGLEADMQFRNDKSWQTLKKAFGDQIRKDGDRIVWRHDLFKEVFATGGNFTIRLGCASPDLLSKLPGSVPAHTCAGKPLVVEKTWLDNKRKDGTDHRAHFAPLADHPDDIPLTMSDIELLPEIWRKPDRVKDAKGGCIMLELDTLDGGVMKAVVKVSKNLRLLTLYKEGKTV